MTEGLATVRRTIIILARTALLFGIVLLFSTCRNFFQAGLGEKVDLNPPVVGIASHSDGQYIGGPVTFAGEIADDSRIVTVEISLDRGATWTAVSQLDTAEGSWSHVVDTTTLADAEYEVRVRARDNAAKITEAKILLFVDNTPPTVVVRAPVGLPTTQFNQLVTLSGDAFDDFGVASVEIALYDSAGDPLILRRTSELRASAVGETPLDTADGTNSWNYPFDTAVYTGSLAQFDLAVTATDRAGNTNTQIFLGEELRTLLGRTVTVNEVHTALAGGTGRVGAVDILPIAREQFTMEVNQDEDLPRIEFSVPSGTVTALGEFPTASGSLTDDDGIDIASVEILIDGDPATAADADWESVDRTNGAGVRVNWEHDLFDLGQGPHNLALRVADIEGRRYTSQNVPFTIDYGPPVLVIDAPVLGTYHNANVAMSGVVEDGSGIAGVEVSDDGGFSWEAADVTLVNPPGVGGSSGQWAWTYTYDLDAPGNGADGARTLRVRGIDTAAKTVSESTQVVIDRTLPEIGFLAPSDGELLNGIVTVEGTTDDRSPIVLLELYDLPSGSIDGSSVPIARLDSSVNTFSPDGGGADSTERRWYLDLATTAYQILGEAAVDRTLTAVATDEAGNVGTRSVNVSIDQASDRPVIGFSNADPSAPASANVFRAGNTLLGRVEDDDAVDPATIEYRIDGGAWTAATATLSGTAADFSIPLPDDEGPHDVTVRAADTFGTVSLDTALDFITDIGAPQVSFSRVATVSGTGDYTSFLTAPVVDGGFAIDGAATDGVSVAFVEVNLNGEESAPGERRWITIFDSGDVAGSFGVVDQIFPGTDAATRVTFSGFLIDESSFLAGSWPADGPLAIDIRTVDGSGQTGTTTLTVSLDRTAPTNVITGLNPVETPADGSTPATVNGTINVSGSAADASPNPRVFAWVGPDGDPPPVPVSVAAGWTLLGTTNTWSTSINTRGLADGTWTLHSVAIDAAGNESAVATIDFTVDQASDIPTISFDNVDADENQNRFRTTDAITGRVVDDDGVDTAALEVSTDGGTSWTQSGLTIPDSGKTVTFSYVVGGPETPGVRSILVRASDTDPDAAGASVATPLEARFFVDDAAPTLVVDGTVGESDRAIRGSAVPFTGSATDSNQLASLEVRVNGGAPTPIPVLGDTTWSYTFPDSVDGSFDLEFAATDTAGRTATETRHLLIDTTAPVAPAIDALIGAFQENELVTSGTAGDAGSGLSLVEYSFDGSTWSPATGTANWFANVDISVDGAGPGADLAEGSYTLSVRATDRAGNVSTPATAPFTVDRADPVLTVDGSPGTEYRNTEFTITGSVSDTLPLTGTPESIVSVTATLGGNPVDLSGEPIGVAGSGTSRTWSQTIPIGDGDGDYVVTITVTDAVGRIDTATRTIGVDQIGPTISVTNVAADGSTLVEDADFTVRGTASDAASGVDRVEYSLDGGSSWADATGTTSWTIPLPGLDDALGFDIQIRAFDAASNPSGTVVRTFDVDLAEPLLAVTGGNTTPSLTYLSGDIVLSGTATDDGAGTGNGIVSVTVDYSLDGAPDVSLLNDTTDDGTWTANLPVATGDGSYEFTIVATDGAGKTTRITRTVQLDTVDPTAEVTSVTPTIGTNTVNGRISLRAAIADDISLATTEWAILPQGDTPVPGDWTTVTGSRTAPLFEIDTTQTIANVVVNGAPAVDRTLADGAVSTVHLRATDRAGNTATTTQDLSVDQTSDLPTITFRNIDDTATTAGESSRNLIESSGTILLEFEDDDLVDVASIEVSVGDASSWGPINYDGEAAPANARRVTTGHDLYGSGLLAEGTTSFYLRFSDAASAKNGLSAAQDQVGPIYVMVDRSFPTIDETTIGTASTFRDALFSLGGTVGDTNALADVVITEAIDGGLPVEIANLAVTGTSDSWTVVDLPDGGVAADGQYDYVISVTDASGKTTAVNRRVTIDTTDPLVPTVTSPTDLQWIDSSTFLFIGTASDGSGSGVASLYWVETVRGGTPPAKGDPAWTEVTVAPDGSWNATVAVAAAGERTFHAYTVDAAGNDSTIGTRNFGLDQAVPSVVVSGDPTLSVNTDFSISGSFTDLSGLASVGVEVSDDGSTYNAASPATGTFDNGLGTWSWNHPLGAQLDGDYTYRFTFTDRAGNAAQVTRAVNLDRVAPAIDFSATAPSIDYDDGAASATANGTMSVSGTVSDDQGIANLDSLEYRVDGGAWQPLALSGSFTIGAIDTTAEPDLQPLAVDVRAFDGNGNSTVETFTLNVDQSTDNPVVSITTPLDAATVNNTSVSIIGEVTDDEGVSGAPGTVQYRFSETGLPGDLGPWQNVTVGGVATNRTFNFPITAASDGAKLLQMRASDTGAVVSATTEIDLTFNTDEPELVNLAPTSGTRFNADFTLSGEATEDGGDSVTLLRYRVLKDSVEILGWTDLAGTPAQTVPFSTTIDTSAGDGAYRVEIQAGDGSFTRTRQIDVTVDTTPPTLVYSTPAAGSIQNNTISITGTASDTLPGSVTSVDFEVLDATDGVTLHALPTGAVSGTSIWQITGFDTRDGLLESYAEPNPDGDNPDEYEVTLRGTVTDDAGNSATGDLVFRIDQTADRPAVTFDVIETDGSTTAVSPTIRGTVTDDDGVAQILVDTWRVGNATATPDDSETVTLRSGNYGGTDLDWEVTLADSGNGLRGIRVRAIDTADNNGADYGAIDWSRTDTTRIDFQLDTENPDVAVGSPISNTTWSANDTFTVSGSAGDETGITALAWKADDTDFSTGATSIPDSDTNGWATWSFTIAQAALSNGPHTIYVQATDSVGNTRIAQRQVSVDKAAPTISVTSPVAGSAVFGPLTIGGTAADNPGGAGVESVSVGLGLQIDPGDLEGSTWIDTGGSTSWQFSFLNINDFANTTYSVNTGDTDQDGVEDGGETWTDLWDFTFYVRAVDSAGDGAGGNIAYLETYTLQIDPKRDRPEVSVLSPTSGSTVGGFVRVFGSAFDGQFVEKVQIAIDGNNNGDYTDDSWSEGTVDETDGDGVNWYLVNGTTSWNINLNEAGEFDPTGMDTTRTIAFRVRAWDYKVTPGDGIAGADVETTVTFNKDFPQFAGLTLASGATVGGTVNLDGIVRDETDIARIIFAYEGPILQNTVIYTNPGGLLPPPATGNVTGLETAAAAADGITVELLAEDDPAFDVNFPGSYRVSIPIDTTGAGLYPSGAGSMSVRLTAEDTTTPSPFTNQNPITFSVDNVVPSSLGYTGDTEILGTSAELRGTVRDTGTVSGIQRVVAYVTDASGDLVRLQNGAGSLATFSLAEILDEGNPAFDDYRMVIDNALEDGLDGGAAGDNDGIAEFLTLSGGTYNWAGQFDSTQLTDGAVTVNFVAEDFAGNRTVASTAAFIANNRPTIDSLVLGTDLNGDGDVADAGEQSSPITAGFATTGYTARNNRLSFDIAAGAGNGTLRYSVWYDADGDTIFDPGEELNAVLTNNTLTVDTSTIPDSVVANDRTFVVLVYDSTTSDDVDSTDELSDSVPVGLTIDNVDTVNPTVSIAPFGRTYNESADDALKALAAVGTYEDNIAMSGDTRLGHVEYAVDSLFDNGLANGDGTDDDADLSGRIVFRGKVADDQRIDRISATIAGFDGGNGSGAAFDVYYASDPDGAGPLVAGVQSGGGWAFALDGSEYLAESTGNVFNWTLEWNTADHANVVTANATIDLTVYDLAGNNTTGSAGFDIVPYISAVSTDTTGIRDRNIRAASGAYSIRTGNTASFITIRGFNLNPIADGVRVATDPDGLVGTTLQGTGLTIDTQGSPYTTVAVRNDADRSGYLSVVGGTPAAPIPTANNVNDNALGHHQEPSTTLNNPTLTDDRYLRFFDVTATSYLNAGFPEMIMNGDTPVWGYIDKSAERDLQLRRDNDGIVRALSMTHAAMTRDDDGRYYHIGTNDFSGGRLELFYDQYATLYPTSSRGADAGATQPYWSNYTGGDFSLNADNNAVALDPLDYDGTFFSNRYLYPKLEARGRSNTAGQFASLYIAYFDARDSELIFRDARFGHTVTATNLYDGSAAYSDVGTNMANASGDPDANRHLVSTTASEYFDMGVTSTNTVVIVYYNQAATQLEMVYTTNAIDGNDTPTWSTPLSLGATFAGTYVSMFVDSSDRIHIAAYDSAGADLRYFFLEDVTDTTPESVLVDATNSVGLWTEVAVNAAGELYIAYYNNSENGTRDSIKLARFNGTLPTITAGVDGNGDTTGNWEYMTVPTTSVPQGGLVQFGQVNLGFDSGDNPVIGYLGSNLEYAVIRPEIP